jgi:dTDP-4-amino-4,6-dideoxygalactose transaminase
MTDRSAAALTAVTPDRPASMANTEIVPVLRPRLPRAEALMPYLRRIDESRVYTNFGPLVLELEVRLHRHFGLANGNLVSASSGTAGLIGAILASAGRAGHNRPYALMPSFTFVATAVAAELCGYRPCFGDVDARTWILDPDALLQHPQLDQVGVIIPVATFGRPVPQAAWESFSERTGIPVIIDGAASIEAVSKDPARHLGSLPVVMSFHATKSFATGEGGCVITTDTELTARAFQALNFGFYGTRDSRGASTNGKMSEYHAAVGLAELDGWEGKLNAYRAVADMYRQGFLDDEKTLNAVAKNLENIGEAPKCIQAADAELTKQYPGVPWNKIYAMRVVLAHRYFRIDPEVVWDTIQV